MASNPTKAPAWWENPSEPCGRPTKTGTPCPRGRGAAAVYAGFRMVWESPACKTHLTREEREARQAAEAQVSAAHARIEPACWSWPPPAPEDLIGMINAQPQQVRGCLDINFLAFEVFHNGRCAICGRRTPAPVRDHDHSTGMIRGILCHNCNVTEGVSAYPLFAKYRAQNPASILRVQLPYSGYGWVDGVPVEGWSRRIRHQSAWVDNAATALDL